MQECNKNKKFRKREEKVMNRSKTQVKKKEIISNLNKNKK
jgi:hypothetical protein